MPRRAVTGLLVVLIVFVPGCARERAEDGGSARILTVDEVREGADDLVGDDVILRAEVAQILAPRIVRVGALPVGERAGLVVVHESGYDFKVEDTIEVRGVVRDWSLIDLEQYLGENLNLEFYNGFDEDVIVVADSISVVDKEER